jgi:phage tail-like protein
MDFTDRFLSLFDTTLRGIEGAIDGQARYYDPLSAPSDKTGGSHDFLTWLASWVGVSMDRQWPEAKRRMWLKQAAKLYRLRGTRTGLRNALLIFLGLDPAKLCCECDGPRTTCACAPNNCAPPVEKPCTWEPPRLILEHFELRRWLFVGRGRLGDNTMVWGQRIVNRSQLDAGSQGAQVGQTQLKSTPDPFHDPFRVYAHKFSVFVPAAYGDTPTQRRALENLIQAEKPAHTVAQIEYVRPLFRIGQQSMLGYDAVVGRYPEGITLNEAQLGAGSIIGGAPGLTDKPNLVIGHQSRVGATTHLAQ